MRAAILTTLLLTASPVAGAHANGWSPIPHAPPPTSDQQVYERTMHVVQDAWPQSPCRDRLAIRVVPRSYLEALAADEHVALQRGAGVFGYSQWETCTAFVREGLTPTEFCVIAVHEAGHIAGREHVDDPDDVMSPSPTTYRPCERALVRAGWERIYDQLREIVGAGWWLSRPVYSRRIGAYWVRGVDARTGRSRRLCVRWTSRSVRILGGGWNEVVWAAKGEGWVSPDECHR